jgi:hypothetical protein
MNGVIQRETEPILLTTIDLPLAQAATCPQTLGILAGGYRVTKFNSPPSVRIGEDYLPSANWIVTEPSPDAAGRVFIFRHGDTGEEYFCAAGDHAASSWVRGEYVYFDRCPMTFPAEATPGEYAVSLVMVNAAGEWLPAMDAGGNVLTDNMVMLGTVRLEEWRNCGLECDAPYTVDTPIPGLAKSVGYSDTCTHGKSGSKDTSGQS